MDVNLKTQGLIDITLKPREIFLGERGSMSFCDGGIKYSPIETNFFKSVKRFLGGESFYSIVKFENTSNSNQNLKLRYDTQENAWFHHNSTNTDIIFIDLNKINGDLIIKAGSFFAATNGVTVDVYLDSNWARSLFGFGKLFKQKISGTGTVFIQKDRWLHFNEIHIEKGKSIIIDPKEVYAYSLNSLNNMKKGFSISNFLTGEGFSSYNFEGPGTIYTYKNRPPGFNTSTLLSSPIVWMIIIWIIIKFIF